jgi:uncharacterized membrane protein
MTGNDGIGADANTAALPFVAPCRTVHARAPLEWVRKGWSDFLAAPRQSLAFGALVVLLSWALAFITVRFGGYWELLALASGFIFIAPLLAVGTYAISDQLEHGERPSLRRCINEEKRALGNLMVFALILLIVFLVWWRAASAVHVFFPIDARGSAWQDYLEFLLIGSAIGSIFAAAVFSAAAFALPMLVDRRTDAVTAVVTSVNAVLRNKPAMLVWASLIALAVAPGFALLMLGRDRGSWLTGVMILLGITLPVIGHATWHGYRAVIDASAWPPNERS